MISIERVDIEDKILNADEAGKMFGIEASAMYKRAKKNMIPFHKMGRRVYFLKSEIVAFVRNN